MFKWILSADSALAAEYNPILQGPLCAPPSPCTTHAHSVNEPKHRPCDKHCQMDISCILHSYCWVAMGGYVRVSEQETAAHLLADAQTAATDCRRSRCFISIGLIYPPSLPLLPPPLSPLPLPPPLPSRVEPLTLTLSLLSSSGVPGGVLRWRPGSRTSPGTCCLCPSAATGITSDLRSHASAGP